MTGWGWWRIHCGQGVATVELQVELWGPEPQARSCELLTLCTTKGPGSCGQAKDLDTHRKNICFPLTSKEASPRHCHALHSLFLITYTPMATAVLPPQASPTMAWYYRNHNVGGKKTMRLKKQYRRVLCSAGFVSEELHISSQEGWTRGKLTSERAYKTASTLSC